MERAGAARCLSEAGRHCREAAAITTAAVKGTVPGVSTRDTGPCGTGSAGPVRWEGRVTSREGGPGRGRWFEAPLLLRAGSSNCGGTRGPRKRTTSRGRGSTASRAQNGLVPAARFYLGTPVPLGAWCPAAAPSAPGPALLGSAVSRSPSGPCPVNSVFSVSVSSAPYSGSPSSPSEWGLGAVPLLPPSVSGPSLHSADTYFGSSLILLPVLSRLSASSLPPAGASCF